MEFLMRSLIILLILALTSLAQANSSCSKKQISKASERCDNWSPARSRDYIRGSCKNSGSITSYMCKHRDGSIVVGKF